MKLPHITITPMTAVMTVAAVAAAFALTRAIRMRHDDQHREEVIDHTLEDSFPASDPPAF